MDNNIVIEITRDELELIRKSLRTQENWYSRSDFKSMAMATSLLRSKVNDIMIELELPIK
ncbi:MAG: hypothetical protein EBR73_14890 [Rhodobacteraceae bacterium]|jgi:hypothetical protein|nr:hypothetical protein [Paracoccaceae bacterium]